MENKSLFNILADLGERFLTLVGAQGYKPAEKAIGEILMLDPTNVFGPLLQIEGFKVHTLVHVNTLIKLIRTEKPSLIILDIELPNQTGIEILKKIKDLGPQIPVIVLSNLVDAGFLLDQSLISSSSFLRKPLDIKDLTKTIKKSLPQAHKNTESSIA